jgi:hypothetical protein
MGMTFSTIQIINRNQIATDKFIELLSKYLEKKGLIPTTEEESETWYRLIISKDKRWISVYSPEYDDVTTINLLPDVRMMVEEMQLGFVVSSVIDSDMLLLHCYNETGKLADKAVLGRPNYVYEDTVMGKPGFWGPLLTENYTFEDLLEVWKKDETYAEDILSNMAPLLGMYPEQFSRENSTNEIIIHYKKTENAKKPQSFNAVFKQVFGEALAPLGFVHIKGKHPYFVRLIGDEIVHIITCKPEPSSHQLFKSFNILGGVATVYRQRITLDQSPGNNSNWLCGNLSFYEWSGPFNYDRDMSNKLYNFTYITSHVESLRSIVKQSLMMTEQYMLPVLNEVTDLDSCVEFFSNYSKSVLNMHYADEDFGNKGQHFSHEGLLFIKIYNRDEYYEKWERFIERELAMIDYAIKVGRAGFTRENYEKKCKASKAAKPLRLAHAYEIFDNREWCAKAFVELERRKAENIGILRSYGIGI